MEPSPLSRRSFLGAMAGAIGLPSLGLPSAVPTTGRWLGRVATLSLPPFLSRPTTDAIHVSARNGHVDAVAGIRIRPTGAEEWAPAGAEVRAAAGQFLDWTLDGLEAGARYDYQVMTAAPGGDPEPIVQGAFSTQRLGEESFRAAFITDAHTGAFIDGQRPLEVLDQVVHNVRRAQPEFVMALGDNVAWSTSRNSPQEDALGATRAYTMYRRHLGPLSTSCPHYGLIGNWEGESGKLPAESIALVEEVRRQYTPNPRPDTYPQGGGLREDYYAFEWGPALFVVLNVQSYSTPSGDQPSPRDDVSVVEDWSLGPEQFAWMEATLAGSDHPFKFICIHHAVGGAAANETETLYGRGGAQAARVGEQRLLHEAMLDHGVQVFFYGHDHVFVDDVVDGIHYTLPGSCGAPWKFGRDVTGYSRHWPDSGHAVLDVRPDRATVQFVGLAGQIIHQFSVEAR